MSQMRSAETWDQRYHSGDLPWDSGEVDENLLQTLEMLQLRGGRALEIGCGTGTNAIALARLGFESVTALDIAPKAIEMARAKVSAAGVANITLLALDIIAAPPAPAASIDFAFDRGVFHSVSDEQRPIFARRVAEALRPGGWWLSLCGNADDKTPGGPPRLTAAHIAAVVEPLFEIHALDRSRFRKVRESASDNFINWRVLLRKR